MPGQSQAGRAALQSLLREDAVSSLDLSKGRKERRMEERGEERKDRQTERKVSRQPENTKTKKHHGPN